jgi:hypothetical protein
MPGAKHYRRPADSSQNGKSRSRRPVWQRALLGAAALVLLALLVVLGLLLASPGEVTPQGSRTPSGLERTMQQAVLDLERSRLTPGFGARDGVRISLTDADLDDYLAVNAGGRSWPLDMRDPRLAFGREAVSASARARLGFLPVRVTAEFAALADKGRLRVRTDRLHVGLLPVPRRYREWAAEEAENAVNSGLHETDFRLEDLEIAPGRITATLRPADPRR